jgi:carbamoylphosphate synthase large subunit
MSRRILVTGAGSGGAENLITSLRMSDLDLFIYGSNMDEYMLGRSSADSLVWLPSARADEYIDRLERIVHRENVELVIPNNDTEVDRISRDREQLSCKVFLPPKDTVETCHDKLKMHKRFAELGIPQASSREISSHEDIKAFMEESSAGKYWVRPRRGSGSMGATWVETYAQAKAWIDLWIEMRDFRINDFIISEFLPGRDYAFQSVWKDGRLAVAKMVERLVYFMGRNRLSNMSSTPAVARTVKDDKALDTIFKAIHGVAEKPNGNFCLDLKGNSDGEMCVTEFNIGRFCMITPVFDRTGKYNTAEIYVRCALDSFSPIEDPIDIEEEVYLIRDLDTLPTIVREEDLRERIEAAKRMLS